MNEHVRAQLSAYLDRALGDAERATVEAHLATCADCRARLGELRATASLIRGLQGPVPSRRLVPRVAAPPVWVAPLRTLTTLASGLSVFLFLATALLANVNGLASGSATTAAAPAVAPAPTAAPSQARGVAPAAGAPTTTSNADTAKQAATASPSGAAFSVTQNAPTPAEEAAAPARNDRTPAAPLTSPWLWLGLAIATAIAALALQRRLRSI